MCVRSIAKLKRKGNRPGCQCDCSLILAERQRKLAGIALESESSKRIERLKGAHPPPGNLYACENKGLEKIAIRKFLILKEMKNGLLGEAAAQKEKRQQSCRSLKSA